MPALGEIRFAKVSDLPWKSCMTAADQERFHPLYRELHAELLSRSFPVVSGQVMVAHRAIIFTPSEAPGHHAAVAALADYPGVSARPAEPGFQLLRWGAVDLRIEWHTEFTTFTAFAPQDGAPFAKSAIEHLPEGWLDAIPGRVLAAVEIASELVPAGDAGTAKAMERVGECFGQERLVGGWVVERVASVWSHFRLDDRGATRFLVQIHRLTSGRYGRLLQRLLEIENYRMAAMLGLPFAREVLGELETLEARQVTLMGQLSGMNEENGRALLAEFTDLALANERLHARCGPRLGMTDSYSRILSARVRELREEQVPGYQTLGEFFGSRLDQAWHSCDRAEAGLKAFSERLQIPNGVLQTTATLNFNSRNSASPPLADLPEGQPRGPQVWAALLTYYGAIFLKLLLDGTKASGMHFDSALAVALAVPLLGYGVWLILRHRSGEHR